jgi:ABC-type Zn uptake system ZnuABC Zn-binding protein ZnuA
MRKLIPLLILVLFAALLFGCTQQGQQAPQGQNQSSQPPSQQPNSPQPGQTQVTAAPIEDIAAQALENNVPSGSDNLTNLDDLLVNATS